MVGLCIDGNILRNGFSNGLNGPTTKKPKHHECRMLTLSPNSNLPIYGSFTKLLRYKEGQCLVSPLVRVRSDMRALLTSVADLGHCVPHRSSVVVGGPTLRVKRERIILFETMPNVPRMQNLASNFFIKFRERAPDALLLQSSAKRPGSMAVRRAC